ncbi:hypothetical protein KC952_01845 [Candidatus Saccharibacteria bacterium]|nr:hypothetical protein [Candidatus Saccharibacteria bacterium]
MKTKHKKRTQGSTRTKNKGVVSQKLFETDSTYFLKLIAICILATLWLKFTTPIQIFGTHLNAVPVGLMTGLLVVRAFEHSQDDRKIWYAVLIIVGIISYFVPAGLVI